MNLLRIDDFPHGDKVLYESQKNCYKNELVQILSVLEEKNIKYMLGVSPLLCNDYHIEILKSRIKSGKIVMHGFDHGFNKIKNWNKCKQYWPKGGEFSFYSINEMNDMYLKSLNVLIDIPSFDKDHFIPPFNCFNQNIIDVLNKNNVKYIHGCEEEYNAYNQNQINYGSVKFINYKLRKGYDYAIRAIRFISSENICLHWIYDLKDDMNWLDSYKKFTKEWCKKIQN